MRVGNFSLLVPQGQERDSGHVMLQHGTVYTLRLLSHFHRACDALVKVDGKEVGGFRLEGHGSLTLERSADDTGRFTFYAAESSEGQAVGGGIAKDQRGLIEVTFKPEKDRAAVRRAAREGYLSAFSGDEKTSGGISRSFGLESMPKVGCSAGVTGLTGKSNQEFVAVPNLDYDLNEVVTITLRLVVGQDSPSPVE